MVDMNDIITNINLKTVVSNFENTSFILGFYNVNF